MRKNLFEHTLYINLEHRTDRKAHVEKEMQKMGITATRFNAIKTKNGAVGCSMSHLACLQMAKANGWPQVFIAGDDICFSNPDLLLSQINAFVSNSDFTSDTERSNLQSNSDTENNSNQQHSWDVLLVAGNNAPPFEPIGNYCVRVRNCRAATGYIVQQHYYDTLIDNFKGGLQGLIKAPHDKPNFACDMYWMRLQAVDKWYLIVPLTVYQLEGYSDIEERHTDYRHLMVDLEKKWLNRWR
jgi:GR25 family glycosyltransferase involved in LPS biosynthesis